MQTVNSLAIELGNLPEYNLYPFLAFRRSPSDP